MTRHPVQLHIDRPTQTRRIEVVIRLVLLVALGTIGCSSIYWLLYLALPALAAVVITQKGGERFLAEEGPRVVRVLRWFASAYGYLWLLSDVLPTADGSPVDLQIEVGGRPTATSALLRLIYSLPVLILVVVLSLAGGFLWLIGAAYALVKQRMPGAIADFLALTLRVQFRLLAYHLSLVERYPSLEDAGLLPAAT